MILASIVTNAVGAAATASNAHPGTYPGAPSSIWIGLAVPLGLLAIFLAGQLWNWICKDNTEDKGTPPLLTKCRKLGLFVDQAGYTRVHGRWRKVFRIHICFDGFNRVLFESRNPQRAYAEAHAWVDKQAKAK